MTSRSAQVFLGHLQQAAIQKFLRPVAHQARTIAERIVGDVEPA